MNANDIFPSNRTLEPGTDETTLISLSQGGNREMFAQLYEAYIERIYRYIYYRVVDNMLAEDLTSQVFLKAWEKLDSYEPGQSPFAAWLYRIARNTIIDYYRTKKAAISLDEIEHLKISHTDEVDKKLDLQAQAQELHEALLALTAQQQKVLVLRFIRGFSTAEIARQLGKQQGAVRALQMRGLHELSKCQTIQRSQAYAQ